MLAAHLLEIKERGSVTDKLKTQFYVCLPSKILNIFFLMSFLPWSFFNVLKILSLFKAENA